MKHSQFIEKMAAYKGTKKGNNFYERHKDDPQRPEFGEMTHKSVMDASHFLKLSDMVEFRKSLIREFATNPEGGLRPQKRFLSFRLIRQLLTKSGLEWFEKNHRPIVHWKHLKELA